MKKLDDDIKNEYANQIVEYSTNLKNSKVIFKYIELSV